MREYKYTVIIEPDLDNGGSVATVPVLGIATQGEPLPETRRMVREAISGYIEGRRRADPREGTRGCGRCNVIVEVPCSWDLERWLRPGAGTRRSAGRAHLIVEIGKRIVAENDGGVQQKGVRKNRIGKFKTTSGCKE